MRRKYDLVCFDMDGVLTKLRSSWAWVHQSLGVENEAAYQAFINQEIDEKEFMRRDIAKWKSAKPDICERDLIHFFQNMPVIDGIQETVAALQECGMKCVIISGGIDLAAKMLKNEYGFDDCVADKVLTNPDGTLSGEGEVVVDLKEYGVVQRALLGLAFRPIDQNFIDQMGEETGIEELGGVYVASVSEGGAASQAGIRKGDVILSVDGVELNEAATLQEQIGKHRPTDKVKLMIKRSGSMKQIEVTLRNKAGKTELLTRDDVDVMEVLGGKFATADERLCRRLEIRGGVEVLAIKANGILSKARVRPGFVITHINDKSVRSLSDMQRMTDKVRSIDGVYPDGRSASYVLVE